MIRIEVLSKNLSYETEPIDEEIFNFLDIDLREIKSSLFYLLGDQVENEELEILRMEVFSDPVSEYSFVEEFDFTAMSFREPCFIVEITYLPGVTDNSGKSASEGIELVLGKSVDCYSGKLFYLYGDLTNREAEKISKDFLGNQLIEKIEIFTFDQFVARNRFNNIKLNRVELNPSNEVNTYNLDISDDQLLKLSIDNIWALNLDEMKVIQSYYLDNKVTEQRLAQGLPPEPTDVEIEILAQTWSEHCKHKIFASTITYQEGKDITGPQMGDQSIESLYKTYIKGATKKLSNDWLVSVFSDNAGIVSFSDKVNLAIKVETHNSPSALDPYGGALTGIVGVNRDILGVGLGARPIANTNVLCFAPPSWPTTSTKDELPAGLHHPKRILNGVHKGIEDGGNKSGIPTVNGAIYFDYNYAGKPLVYCGTIGVLEKETKSQVDTSKKYHEAGDRVVMVGGRIGVDGIHGATFSSLELDENAPATAVQIGDPFTQRRLTDFMMMAQEQELFSSVTDNGAGGLSSSVGEMAEKTNGAEIDVAKALTKYSGVKPFELVISESQERMTFAVPKEKLDKFLNLANDLKVEASDLGEFKNDGFFTIKYEGKIVGKLSMDFLHNGLPVMNLEAEFHGPKEFSFKEELKIEDKSLRGKIQKLLSSPNIASKEKWIRQYDHEVQASTLVKPLVGKTNIGPSDSGVIWLGPHGGDDKEAIAIGCGMNPRLSYYDSYLMTQYAVDEAIRNIICQGAQLEKIALIDNFCWPDPIETKNNPGGKHKLGLLVRSCKALYDLSVEYGTPFVSGKDSMKNDFKGKMNDGSDIKISVPPTLLITAMGHIEDIDTITTSNFKEADALIYLVGEQNGGLLYSEYHRYFSDGDFQPPEYIDSKCTKKRYKNINQAQQDKVLSSIHDISDGGMIISIIESFLGSQLGCEIELSNFENIDNVLFNERAGRFIVSVSKEDQVEFENIFQQDYTFLGKTTHDSSFKMTLKDDVIEFSKESLRALWGGNHG